MPNLLNFPFVIFILALFLLWLAARLGGRISPGNMTDEMKVDFGLVQGATMTLLGLIIGFSFSMATSRYDLRKTYEEGEANAIGTEFVRADLLPDPEAAQVRAMLRQYTDVRLHWYVAGRFENLGQINADTAKVQNQMWATVAGIAKSQPTPVHSLVTAGMNDVLNAQGYTQAAWWNRIPVGAWCLMFGIGLFANFLMGYGARRKEAKLFIILPLVVAISFFLIADIDSPRGGVIRVRPQNLEALQESLK